jgi:hypothetical protein
MIMRSNGRVKTQEFALDLCGAGIEVLATKRPGLLRQAKDRDVGTHVCREPILVDLKVVVGDAHPDPASPREVAPAAHLEY